MSRDLQPLVEERLTGCLVWNSDGSIPAGESLLHRVNHELVLCSACSRTTRGYRSSTCWTVPNKGYCIIAGKFAIARFLN